MCVETEILGKQQQYMFLHVDVVIVNFFGLYLGKF